MVELHRIKYSAKSRERPPRVERVVYELLRFFPFVNLYKLPGPEDKNTVFYTIYIFLFFRYDLVRI